MKEEYLSASPEQTEEIGRQFAEKWGKPTLFVALYGDLGVGKTAFVRGFVSALSVGRVKSPTFSLVNRYPCDFPLYHFDLYRIDSQDDLEGIGYWDYLDGSVCLCEWSEKIPYAIPENAWKVTIEKTDIAEPDHRKITIESPATL